MIPPRKRQISDDEYYSLMVTLNRLAGILIELGVIHWEISKREKVARLETSGDVAISEDDLIGFCSRIEEYDISRMTRVNPPA